MSTEGEENIQPMNSSELSIQDQNYFYFNKLSSSSKSNKILQSKHNEIDFSPIFHNESMNDSIEKIKSTNHPNDGVGSNGNLKQTRGNEPSNMKTLPKVSVLPNINR